MNINGFKPGDVITRTVINKLGDRSYMMEKVELIGVGAGIIFVLSLDNNYRNGGVIKLAEDTYAEGWEHFPQGLEATGIKRSQELFPERWSKSDSPCGGSFSGLSPRTPQS